MSQEINSLLTGLATSLNQYMGLGIQNQLEQQKETRKNEATTNLKTYEHQLDLDKMSKTEIVKRAMQGEIDLDTATTYAPEARAFAEGYKKKNGQYPTPDIMEGWLKSKGLDNPKNKATGAQNTVDREFGKEYARYVAGGGYADTMNQIQTLDGVLADLKGGKKQLTGPVVGALPDFARKRVNSGSMAAQQAVEQSVQRSLKQTLGGQFTEKEGTLFMQRGYDPSLPEAENAKKLARAIGQLKSMAASKQRAVDYYEENGSLQGYKGEFYTLKNGEIVKATKDDFYKMIGEPSSKGAEKSENSDPLGLGI